MAARARIPVVARMLGAAFGAVIGQCLPTALAVTIPLSAALAQGGGRADVPGTARGVTITGRIVDAGGGQPVDNATVTIEGSGAAARSDASGRYRVVNVPPGPQVLLARRVGYAPARVAVTVSAPGPLEQNIEMAPNALQMRDVQVTADVSGRARGELGTATVITRDAIANQGAASLAGILELSPGVPLRPPGLDNVQQFALRTVPTTSGVAERLAAAGTVIILDGVPLTNTANLQTTGPRGEIVPATSAGGGIDLRRIPAAALERVEVVRGVPSARYGNLTQGTIIIDTRAGVTSPEALVRYDPRTTEANATGGFAARRQALALGADLTRTQLQPGVRDADVWRATFDASHRLALGVASPDDPVSRGVLETRASLYQVYRNEVEQPDVRPGHSSSDRSGGLRLSERARFGSLVSRRLEVTASIEREWQDTRSSEPLIRGAEPFTDRLTPGRSTGHFVGGTYDASLRLQGAPWHLYSRIEGVVPGAMLGGENTLRIGTELRRDWNGGPGYQFDIEFPPQATFNGVNGFDRPRRFDATPAVASSAAYADSRWVRAFGDAASMEIQAGLRTDVLHAGTWWAAGVRSAALEPRINVQVSPRPWLRLRAAWGRTAQAPSIADLYPAPQYYDVINVNWYPPNPAERLAVLTTSILDPTNPGLGLVVATKSEAGVEMDLGRSGASLSVVGFHDVTAGGVGYDQDPRFLLREHFALSDSAIGTGRPPVYLTPPQTADTVPVFLDRPRNRERLENTGLEWTLALPEWAALRTRLEVQGAWTTSRLSNNAVDFGQPSQVDAFQLDARRTRSPYWLGNVERGERSLVTLRAIHHQPALGLVLTATAQYFIRENTVQQGATDTLAWAGYVTRTGVLVPVPPEARGEPQYAGLRVQRSSLLRIPFSPPPDWLLSVQLAKTVFGTGRLAFYAFNAFDRLGQPATASRGARLFQPLRFGVELSAPLGVLRGAP